MGDSLIYQGYRKLFDEEGADVLTYATIYIIVWLSMFLMVHYLQDHLKWNKATLYDFPIPPGREPIPKEEAN